jgi:hypothetical protein
MATRTAAKTEIASQRMVTIYVVTGLLFLVLPGTFLGVWNLAPSAAGIPSRDSPRHGCRPTGTLRSSAAVFRFIIATRLGIRPAEAFSSCCLGQFWKAAVGQFSRAPKLQPHSNQIQQLKIHENLVDSHFVPEGH